MVYLVILFTCFILLPFLFFIFSNLFNKILIQKNFIIRYIIFFFIFTLFVIIQVLSLRHNFFENLNELLFIYLWWYFIFSMYGLYRREYYLRLLEPIKFSLSPIYFYKLVKRSIKIRFIVMKELFLSLNAKECIIVGIIFIMSYACLRILRACLIYELINIYGLEEKVTKYLAVYLVTVYEIIFWLKQMSEPIIKMCKTPLIESIQGLILGEMEYTYKKISAKQISKTAEAQTGLEELRASILTMKKVSDKIMPVIRGENPYIMVGKKEAKIPEIVISNPVMLPKNAALQTITTAKLQETNLVSENGVALFNLQTGFPTLKLSQSGTEVLRFEDSGNYIDTKKGFIPFSHTNVSILEDFLNIGSVDKQHLFFHENRYSIQQAFRLYKLDEKIKKGFTMSEGSLHNYYKYTEAERLNYLETIYKFNTSLNTKLSPYVANICNFNFNPNDQQLLYEMPMFLSLIKYIDPKEYTVCILKTNFDYHEVDIKIIHNASKNEISLQLKTLTTTDKYLESTIKQHKQNYKSDTDILVISSSVGHVMEILKPKKFVKSLSQSIFNLQRKFESSRIYIPDCFNVQEVVDSRKNLHKELLNHATTNQNITGVSHESCIKPSSIKKKIK